MYRTSAGASPPGVLPLQTEDGVSQEVVGESATADCVTPAGVFVSQAKEPAFQRPAAAFAALQGALNAFGPVIYSGVPSDQRPTGTMNTVTGSSAFVLAKSGEPFEFAPQVEGLVRGTKNIRCGCQGPATSSFR